MREPLTSRWRARLSLPKRILVLYRSVKLRYCEFQIPGSTESPPLRAVYIGEGFSLPYYLKLYHATVDRTRDIPFWRAQAAVTSALDTAPIVLVEINRALRFLLPSGGLSVDSWVQQETDLKGECYRKRRRGIERGWGQKVRRHGYRYTLSRDDGDLSVFYREYYLPHVTRRHAEIATPRPLGILRRALRTGFLVQVWEGERWVSGLVADRAEERRVSLLAAGLHPSLWERMQEGALSAAYYFLFRWAEANGIETVNFCGSRANQMDGVFHHKKLWAAEPRHDPWHHTEVAFFLAPDTCFPRAITQQLVSRGDEFISIGDCRAQSESRRR
jgi:hypothetical protein